MELQLDRLFDGPPVGYVAARQAASLHPVAEPLSFRHFSHEMLQVLTRMLQPVVLGACCLIGVLARQHMPCPRWLRSGCCRWWPG